MNGRILVRLTGVVVVVATVAGGGWWFLNDRDGSKAGNAGRAAAACKPVAVVQGEVLSGRHDLFRLSPTGRLTRLTNARHSFDPSLAPDGSWLAHTWAAEDDWSDEGGYSATGISTVGIDGTGRVDFPREPGWSDAFPAVSPDGTQVAFVRSRGVATKVIVSDRTGAQTRVVLSTGAGEGIDGGPAWSPDGSRLVLNAFNAWDPAHPEREPVAANRLLIVDLNSGVQTTVAGASDGSPTWSPDGRRVALSSRNYESPRAPTIIDLATGDATELPNPPDSTRTNALFAGDSSNRLILLRHAQVVGMLPQQLELVDATGAVLGSLPLELRPLDEGGGILLSGLTTTPCFVPEI